MGAVGRETQIQILTSIASTLSLILPMNIKRIKHQAVHSSQTMGRVAPPSGLLSMEKGYTML